MITVNGPNGITINFPEGTDSATINRVMSEALSGKTGKVEVGGKTGRPEMWSSGQEAITGATMGGSIPVTAGLMTPLEMIKQGTINPVEAYKSARDQMDADRTAYREKNTGTAVASNIAGNLMTGGLAAKGGLTALGRFGSGPVARVGEAAAEGAAYGGITGAMESRGTIGEQLTEAAKGAGVGAAAGGMLAGGAQALGALGSGATSAVRGMRDPEGFAASQAARNLARDNMTVADLANAAKGATPDTMLADLGGENTRRLLRVANNVPGRGVNDIAEAMGERMSGQRQRLMGGVSGKLAKGELYNATIDDIAATYRAGADPRYQLAYKVPVKYDGELEDLMKRVPASAWGEAKKLMQIEGYQPQQYIADVAPDGLSMTFRKVPDMKQWDYVKRGLDSMISAEDGKGAIGGTTPVGRALTELKDKILEKLDAANPAYAQARKFSSDQIQLNKALKTGGELLSKPIDEAERVFAKLKGPEKEVARIGLARALRNKMIGGSDGSDRVRAVWNEQTRELLKRTFDKKDFRAFARFMEAERQKMLTVNAARGNSTTAQQAIAAMDTAMDPETMGMLTQAAQGNLWGATLGAMSRWARKMGGLNERSAGAIADIALTRKKDLPQTLQRLQEAERRLAAARNRSIGAYPALPRTVATQAPLLMAPKDQKQ